MKLIEKREMRNGYHVFRDRRHAGLYLARELTAYRETDSILLAIPSGGVPVAFEISKALRIPMEVIVVRKLQIPLNPEAGFGAMGPDGDMILNEGLMSHLDLTEEEVETQAKKTMEVIRKREQLFRGGRPFPNLNGKTVILVDDGLASGYTMRAAVRNVRKMLPEKVVVAVPTGASRTVKLMLPEVDVLVCLNVRTGPSFAVADAYEHWYDLNDEEVLALLFSDHSNNS
jgi:putative phosphoribosyl transferase